MQFLTLEEVLTLQVEAVKRWGGEFGLRDRDGLLSALAQPKVMFDGGYLHPTLPDMASAYLFHIVGNHPFIDGNKRAGFLCADAFLLKNAWDFDPLSAPTNDDIYELVISIAQGQVKKAEIANHLGRWYMFLGG